MIKAVNIHKSFGNLEVLKGISMEIGKSEIISIIGASGAGKTTLLQILGTLDKADRGELIIHGSEVMTLNDKALSRFRNEQIGFIFQFHHLLPEFTALENVCIPAYIAKRKQKDTIQKATELLSYLGLEDRLNHKPAELSGGEQQRVAVARALVNNPSVVLADEPSGNLDSNNARDLHKMFFNLRDEYGQSFIIVTHNEELAAMADRILTIMDGVIQ